MSSSDGAARPGPVPAPSPASVRPYLPRADRISSEGAAFLRAELVRQPEIRPEVVERGRALAADPHYPPTAVIRQVAAQLLAAPDLSEVDD
jgi:hypothetical protein